MDQIFYITVGLRSTTKMLLDASAGGTIKNKTIEEVRELIENMIQNDYELQTRQEDSQQLRINTTA